MGSKQEEEMLREAEVLRRNVLAQIAKRFIVLPADREKFVETGQTSEWDVATKRYRFYASERLMMYALDAWLDVKKAFELKTARGRHGRIVALAKKWGVQGF